MIELIRREQPDLLLLQEIDGYRAAKFEDELQALFPDQTYHFAFKPAFRQGIVSRFPLTPLPGSYYQGRAQKVIVETPFGPVNVWNVHLSQPSLWEQHYQQMLDLVESIDDVDGPLIVGGDFNTTDQSEVYRLINQRLYNAHWQAGWGFGFSFPSTVPKFRRTVPIPTPVIRIDHIFYSDHFFARKAQTLTDSGGSDHFPVTAELTKIDGSN